MDHTLWIGGAAVAALAIREAFAFALRIASNHKRSNPPPERSPYDHLHEHVKQIDDRISVINSQVKDLHDWHAKTDQDGVPVWYVRRSLEAAIEKLADNIQKQTDVFSRLVWEIQERMGDAPKSGAVPP